MEKKNIAIIGAGLTGLTAAYRLALKGNKVTIYEKGGSVGGLASGFAINGTNLEKAYHHIFRTDKEIIRLSKELGIEKNLKWNNSSIGLYYEGKMYPFMSAADLLKFKPLSMVSKIRLGLTKIYLEKDKNWEKLVKKPAWLWMKQACGEQAYKVIWEPLLVGKFHEYYKNISMAWLWARIHTRGNSIEKGDSREKLGYFMGGFQAISDALVKKIKEMDGKIELDTTIEKIETKGNKVKVRVDGKDKIFDKVIASIPSEVFGRLIDKNKYKKYIEKLESIDYLGAVNMVFTSKQSLSPYYWHNINDIKSPFLAFIQHTNLIDKSNYEDQNVYYMGTYVPQNHKYLKADEKLIENEFFGYLKNIFSEFDRKEVNSITVFKFPHAQHIVDTNYTKKIPDYNTPLKNVYLANFSQIFPEDRGTNFAVREGEKIASIALKD